MNIFGENDPSFYFSKKEQQMTKKHTLILFSLKKASAGGQIKPEGALETTKPLSFQMIVLRPKEVQ